jgi:hypothetical protein
MTSEKLSDDDRHWGAHLEFWIVVIHGGAE